MKHKDSKTHKGGNLGNHFLPDIVKPKQNMPITVIGT